MVAATRQQPKRQPKGAPPVTTVHPVHAVRGGVSLLALPALALLALVPGVGLLLWACARAQHAQLWLPLLVAVCGLGLVRMLLQHTTARQKTERTRAATTIAWTTIVWSACVVVGPDPTLLLLTFTTGVFLVTWWFMVKTEPVRGIGADGGVGDSVLRVLGLAEGTKFRAKDNDDRKLTVEVEHDQATHDQLQKALPLIESLSKGVKGAWRWAPATKDGRPVAWKSILTYWRADTLAKSLKWTGPDKPEAGVWEPVVYGVCEDGAPAFKLIAPTEDYVGSNAELVMGTTGAAKTAYILDLIGTLVARQGVVLWGADTEKAGQWAPLVRPAFDWFTEDVHELRHMLNALRKIVKRRTRLIMEKTGRDRWTPECWIKHQIPMLVVVIEEAQPVLGELEEEFKTGAQIWRSAGVYVVISLQRASESNIDTDIRNLISERTCFRVVKEIDATFVLSADTIDAGASPWSLALKGDEGIHWTETAAVDPVRWPLRRRTFDPDREELAWTVAMYAARADLHTLDDESLREAFDATKGRYASRQIIGLAEWQRSIYGRAPQLTQDRVVKLLKLTAPTVPRQRPADLVETAPAAELAAAIVRPDGVAVTRRPYPPEPPVLANGSGGPVDDDPDEDARPGEDPDGDDPDDDEEQEVTVATERIMDEIEDGVRRELGGEPPPEGPAPDPSEVVAAARSGRIPEGIDYTVAVDESVPAPSPQQRGVNFQVMIRELFQDADLREYDHDRRAWFLRVGTDRMVERWLQFRGERPGTRPSMYRVMARYERAGLVVDVAHGNWLISEHVLDEPLTFPTDDDEEEQVAHEEATLRVQLGVDA